MEMKEKRVKRRRRPKGHEVTTPQSFMNPLDGVVEALVRSEVINQKCNFRLSCVSSPPPLPLGVFTLTAGFGFNRK